MHSPQPPERRLRAVACAGLAFTLVVVAASAAIRLNASGHWVTALLSDGELKALRIAHRVAASLEVLAAAWAGWLLVRRRRWLPAAALMLLTVGLAVLGIAAGQAASPLQATGNVLGGLALVFVFSWLSGGAATDRPGTLFLAAAFLLLAQALIGARLSILGRMELPALPLHVYMGLALCVGLAFLGRKSLLALAILVPLAGFSALHYEYYGGAALVHALGAAALIVAAARFLGESA